MTPEVLERAIEPFFTTKPKGHGIGLGLATTYGLVNQLSGSLRIESAPGRGTAVTIRLPTTEQTVEPPPVPHSKPAGGTETVLVVDDEDGMRETVTRQLTRAGYTVIAAAADGRDALARAAGHDGPIHLLLSGPLRKSFGGYAARASAAGWLSQPVGCWGFCSFCSCRSIRAMRSSRSAGVNFHLKGRAVAL